MGLLILIAVVVIIILVYKKDKKRSAKSSVHAPSLAPKNAITTNTTKTRHATNKKVSYMKLDNGDIYIDVPEFSFWGLISKSPNGDFVVACSDMHFEGNRMKNGQYVLLKNENVLIHSNKLIRPNNILVANNGTFIINDWADNGEFSGNFYAFDYTGQIIFNKSTCANLLNNGISSDGNYAAFQTCNSNTDDGNKLFFIDLLNKKIEWSKSLPSGWADSYIIDTEKRILILIYKDNMSVEYSFDGDITNVEKWKETRLKLLNGYSLVDIAKDLMAENSQNLSDFIISEVTELLNAAENKDVTPFSRALVFRTFGELNLLQGNKMVALEYFRKALILNPKVGIKKKHDQLTKELNQPQVSLHQESETLKPVTSKSNRLKDTGRNNKGIYSNFVALDIETTGLNAKIDKIIEIGAVKYKDGNIVDKFNKLVNPSIPIPNRITEITGITDVMVKNAPKIETILPEVIRFIEGLPIIAHNASFDMGFIKNNAEEMGVSIDNQVVCTLQMCRKIYSDLENHKLGTVTKHLGIKLENHHRAIDDSIAAEQIYLKCINSKT